jgi:hypothetical protein
MPLKNIIPNARKGLVIDIGLVLKPFLFFIFHFSFC